MNKRIIYPSETGGLCVIIPSLECGLTIDEIALKDVPTGVPFLIIQDNEIPEDRTFRGAWEADFSNPDGFGIGAEAWFAQQGVA